MLRNKLGKFRNEPEFLRTKNSSLLFA